MEAGTILIFLFCLAFLGAIYRIYMKLRQNPLRAAILALCENLN